MCARGAATPRSWTRRSACGSKSALSVSSRSTPVACGTAPYASGRSRTRATGSRRASARAPFTTSRSTASRLIRPSRRPRRFPGGSLRAARTRSVGNNRTAAAAFLTSCITRIVLVLTPLSTLFFYYHRPRTIHRFSATSASKSENAQERTSGKSGTRPAACKYPHRHKDLQGRSVRGRSGNMGWPDMSRARSAAMRGGSQLSRGAFST